MARLIRQLLLSALFIATAGLELPGRVTASPAPASSYGCPARTVCDHALGVALTPPLGWRRVPPGHWPPHTLVWFAPSRGPDYNVRLLIGPEAITHDRNAAHAAATAADRLIAGYRGHVHPTRYAVRYGGSPGVLIRGLPGCECGPDAIIILAHRGAVYSIVAPGTTLASDQQQALATLRFIPRAGPFPSATPPTHRGRPAHRIIKGGVFSGSTLTLTPANSIHRAGQDDSLVVGARPGWMLTYRVGCAGGKSRLVIRVTNPAGRVLDRVLHRTGAARNVRQIEDMAGPLRLKVQSRCATWSVTAAPVYG